MADASASAHVESLHHKARHLGVYLQKTIVFAIFVVLFAVLFGVRADLSDCA